MFCYRSLKHIALFHKFKTHCLGSQIKNTLLCHTFLTCKILTAEKDLVLEFKGKLSKLERFFFFCYIQIFLLFCFFLCYVNYKCVDSVTVISTKIEIGQPSSDSGQFCCSDFHTNAIGKGMNQSSPSSMLNYQPYPAV